MARAGKSLQEEFFEEYFGGILVLTAVRGEGLVPSGRWGGEGGGEVF